RGAAEVAEVDVVVAVAGGQADVAVHHAAAEVHRVGAVAADVSRAAVDGGHRRGAGAQGELVVAGAKAGGQVAAGVVAAEEPHVAAAAADHGDVAADGNDVRPADGAFLHGHRRGVDARGEEHVAGILVVLAGAPLHAVGGGDE